MHRAVPAHLNARIDARWTWVAGPGDHTILHRMPERSQAEPDPGKQSRASAGIPVIPSLDGFRAYAILAIVLYHAVLFSAIYLTEAGTRFGESLTFLGLAVDVLFIISGFVVFLPTVARGGEFGSIGAYAIRRAARLVPAYWLVLVILIILIAATPPHDPPNLGFGPTLGFPGIDSILAHFAFLQTPLAMLDSSSPIGLGVNGPVWTLSLELGFYLVLPFIADAYFRHPWWGLAAAAAITLAWHGLFANLDTFAPLLGIEEGSPREAQVILQSDYQLPGWAFSFGAGMTAAWAFVRLRATADPDRLRHWASLIQPVSIIAVLVAAHLCYRYGIVPAIGKEAPTTAGIGRRAPLVTMGFTLSLTTLILATAFARPVQQILWSNRVIRWMADVSYGTYLAHFVVMTYLLVAFAPPQTGTVADFLMWFALAVPIAVLYGYLSARFLERPIRRWAHRYGRSGHSLRGGPSTPAIRVAGDGGS